MSKKNLNTPTHATSESPYLSPRASRAAAEDFYSEFIVAKFSQLQQSLRGRSGVSRLVCAKLT